MPRFRRCRQPGCHAMVQFPNHYCQEHFEHEAEYLASRQKWARSHDKQYQRKYNTVTRNRNDNKSKQYQFYRSKQWQGLRQQVLDRDHYTCQYCHRPNANTVDHIVPVEVNQSKRADINNLAVICRRCHREKTDWEQEYYGTGKNNKLKIVVPVTNVEIIALRMKAHSHKV